MFSNRSAVVSKVKWAILGSSFISRTMAEAIVASADAELLSIGSRNKISLNNIGDIYHIKEENRHTNLDDVIRDPNVHAVYIGLPNHLHKEWIVRCAEAGKHILCEKPLVLDESEYNDIHAAVVKNNIICLEALMYRHHPFIKMLQKLITEDNIIGRIESIDASYLANIAHLANPLAGGATRNLGCYPISLIRLLTGTEPTHISANGILNPTTNTDHQANIELTFPNNITAYIATQDNPKDKHYHFIIKGSTGTLTCITNPWMAKLENNTIKIDYIDGHNECISTNADKPLYTYQIDLLNQTIISGNISDLNTTSFAHSRGNVIVIQKVVDFILSTAPRKILTN